ncbi:uncharacterized protein LOC115330560, partial [Ixodes scapularis]|uniref:uncharacterized protein LOC115330560 n=1 Tax=Ixodes scapularis TaxID=6945 RepID=UPI001C386E06
GGDADGPARRKALLLHCLGVEGQRVFYTLPETHLPVPLQETTAGTKTPTAPDEYDIALSALETYFAAISNVVVARHRFRQRAQLPGESVEVFVAELRHLSTDCQFGLLADKFIRDQLVAKTTSQRLRERLLLEGSSLTPDRALSIGRLVEEAVRYSKELISSSSVQKVDVKSPKAERPQRTQGEPSSSTSRKCYRCRLSGHLANSATCKAKGKKCAGCGKVGHFRAVCKSTASHTRKGCTVGEVACLNDSDEDVLSILHVHDKPKSGM